MSKRVCMMFCVYFIANFLLMFLVGRLYHWGYFSGFADSVAMFFLEFSIYTSPFFFVLGPVIWLANVNYKVVRDDSIFGKELRDSSFWRWALWEMRE